MIRRRTDKSFLLLSQRACALASAEMLRQVGGDFAAPSHLADLLLCLQWQADGYDEFDRCPMLDAAGRPMHLTDMPAATHLFSWTRSLQIGDSATDAPYARLLLSILVLQQSTTLASDRLGMRELFEVNKFQQREIERQNRLREVLHLEPDVALKLGLPIAADDPKDQQLVHEFRLLTLTLQLATELARHHRVFGKLAPVSSRPGEPPQWPTLQWLKDGRVALAPWPFAPRSIEVHLVGRRIAARMYDHEIELREVWEQAEEYRLSIELSPA